MNRIKQALGALLIGLATSNASALIDCPITVTDGQLEYFSVVLQEIALSEDGTNFDVILLDQETELNTVGQLQGALIDAFENTAVPEGTYTHIRLTLLAHGIKGWVTDGTDMWYTVTNATNSETKRVDGVTTAPTAADYGRTTHTFPANYTNTLMFIKPLVVTAGETSTLIFTENTEAITDVNAEFYDLEDGNGCQLAFLGRGDDVYSMLVTDTPDKRVKVHYSGTNTNAGMTHSLSMLFNTSNDLLGAYSHREGTTAGGLANASLEVTAAGINTYNQDYDITILGDDHVKRYQFTGNYTCTGGANPIYIYEDGTIVPDIDSVGTVDCSNL